MIITIDGPSGSGKTTLAAAIAKEMHFFCMNSGYLYRGLAYVLKKFYGYDFAKMQNPDIADVAAIFESGNFSYKYEFGLMKVYWIDDITFFLKDSDISKLAALIARCDAVREIVRRYERSIVSSKDCVVEGRACGSVVYPNADIKFYIDASLDIRAERFQQDQAQRHNELSISQALEQIKMRDHMDKNRLVEPLVIPQGAIILDSTGLTADELLKVALDEIRKKLKH